MQFQPVAMNVVLHLPAHQGVVGAPHEVGEEQHPGDHHRYLEVPVGLLTGVEVGGHSVHQSTQGVAP